MDTVSEEREDDEVDGREHAAADASLGLDPVVHDGVPVLASQNLRRGSQTDAVTRPVKKSNHF